jgi:hypothetical protein
MNRRQCNSLLSFWLVTSRELFAGTDFWNRKDADSWTSDEVLQLATKSPWAVSARVLPKPGRDRGSVQTPAPDIAGGRSGGRGTGPEPVVQVAEVIVVWESAQPLLDALKSRFPSDFANHYVIGVNDLPRAPGDITASLQARGRDSVGAGAIQPTQNGRTVLFTFSKELLPLTGKDRDVVFALTTDRYSVRARFEPKEMVYWGKLAL